MITLVSPSLPYGFAKRHGVLLLDAGEVARVGLREGADPKALIEARRGTRYTDPQADAAIASLDGPNDRARMADWIGRFLAHETAR